MRVTMIFALCLITSITCLEIYSMKDKTCNGNCPKGDCQECVCGNKSNIVDVKSWCKGGNWEQACCLCIVNLISKGNSNYMKWGYYEGIYSVGLMNIDGQDGDYCGAQGNYEYLCNPDIHIICARKIY